MEKEKVFYWQDNTTPVSDNADDLFHWMESLSDDKRQHLNKLIKEKKFEEVVDWHLRKKNELLKPALVRWLSNGWYSRKHTPV